jgi:hypothetical protein
MNNSKKQNTTQILNTKQKNHESDIKNANLGQKGTNITYDKNQGNRGKQLNPNQKQDGNVTKKQVVIPKPIVKPKPEIIPILPSKMGKPSGPGRGNKTPKPTKK